MAMILIDSNWPWAKCLMAYHWLSAAIAVLFPRYDASVKSRLGFFVFLIWGGSVGCGILMLSSYSYTAGTSGVPPVNWPEHSALKRQNGRATLILFAHPRCLCTAASLEELRGILATSAIPLTCQVVFLSLSTAQQDWPTSSIVKTAEKMTRVDVVLDDSGQEARRFLVATSGHVLLYDASGKLSFSGGITQSRGHRGVNSGTARLTRLLNGTATSGDQTFVFGCPLFNDTQTCLKGVSCQK